jgi:hypothetical protein
MKKKKNEKAYKAKEFVKKVRRNIIKKKSRIVNNGYRPLLSFRKVDNTLRYLYRFL